MYVNSFPDYLTHQITLCNIDHLVTNSFSDLIIYTSINKIIIDGYIHSSIHWKIELINSVIQKLIHKCRINK